MLYSHMTVGTDDIDRARTFYDALFTAMGGEAGMTDEAGGRVVYSHRGQAFVVMRPIDGEAARAGNGMTIGFVADGPAMVDAWHAAGAAKGGTSIEDPPGWRESKHGRYYLAYLRDPDGNKLCATHAG